MLLTVCRTDGQRPHDNAYERDTDEHVLSFSLKLLVLVLAQQLEDLIVSRFNTEVEEAH
jgi:hypothetical protein